MTRGDIRVLLLGGHLLGRYGLRAVLQSQPGMMVIAQSENLSQAAEIVAERRPDVAVLDTFHAGLQASRITRVLLERLGGLAMLLVVNEICRCTLGVFDAGVRGVILKEVQPAELAAAVRSVASGYAIVPSPVLEEMRSSRSIGRPVRSLARVGSLSAREMEVLECLAVGRSNTEIARCLQISEGTVKSHVQHVLNKLGLPDRIHAVIYAYESGFLESRPRLASVGMRNRPAPQAPADVAAGASRGVATGFRRTP